MVQRHRALRRTRDQRPMCPDKKICDEDGKRCLSPEKADKLLTGCAEGEVYSGAEKKCVAKPAR